MTVENFVTVLLLLQVATLFAVSHLLKRDFGEVYSRFGGGKMMIGVMPHALQFLGYVLSFQLLALAFKQGKWNTAVYLFAVFTFLTWAVVAGFVLILLCQLS